MSFKKFLGVFVKTAAVIASVAGIAYVVKQVLDKKAEDDLFDDFDEDFEDDFELDDDEETADSEEEKDSEREYVDINISESGKDAKSEAPAEENNSSEADE